MHKRCTTICSRIFRKIIDKNLICVKNILTPNDNVPLFNGGAEEDLHQFNKFINDLDYKSKDKKNIIGGIQILNLKIVQFFLM